MVEWGEQLDSEIRAGLFGNRLDSKYTDIHQYLPNQIFLPSFTPKKQQVFLQFLEIFKFFDNL